MLRRAEADVTGSQAAAQRARVEAAKPAEFLPSSGDGPSTRSSSKKQAHGMWRALCTCVCALGATHVIRAGAPAPAAASKKRGGQQRDGQQLGGSSSTPLKKAKLLSTFSTCVLLDQIEHVLGL